MLATILMLLAQPAGSGLDVYGEWVIPPKEEGGPSRGTVEITRAEPGSGYPEGSPVGRIATVGEAFEGPEAEEALGEAILYGFEADEEDGRWEDGTIVDPEADRSYDSKVRREGDVLKVDGCVLFICQTQEWVRAE